MSPDPEILRQLVELVARLYAETDGFAENPGDAQLWYNRGYANGMVRALTELGQGDSITVEVDPEDIVTGQEMLAWGKAYLHGLDTGYRETFEVLPATE